MVFIAESRIRSPTEDHLYSIRQVRAIPGAKTGYCHAGSLLQGIHLPSLTQKRVGAAQFQFPVGAFSASVLYVQIERHMGVLPIDLGNRAAQGDQMALVVLRHEGVMRQGRHRRQQQSGSRLQNNSMDTHAVSPEEAIPARKTE